MVKVGIHEPDPTLPPWPRPAPDFGPVKMRPDHRALANPFANDTPGSFSMRSDQGSCEKCRRGDLNSPPPPRMQRRAAVANVVERHRAPTETIPTVRYRSKALNAISKPLSRRHPVGARYS